MNKFQALIAYFKKKYPDQKFEVRSYFTLVGFTEIAEYPNSFLPEIEAFFSAWDQSYDIGYSDASKKASSEYAKNIHEIVTQVYAASYNEGFAAGSEQGFETGIDQEKIDSIIPSDAYDVEVFAVQPSHEFESGKQAFIGYKYDIDGQPQFHFIQAQFSVPNLTVKNKINEKTWNSNCC